MTRRIVSLWFKNLEIDWLTRKQPEWKLQPCAIQSTSGSKAIVAALNMPAHQNRIITGMNVADALALCPSLKLFDEAPEKMDLLLEALADWCFRYTPIVSVNKPNGLLLDVTGCTHLLGGERPFLKDVVTRFIKFGYEVRGAMADTPGAAWAVARYAVKNPIVPVSGCKDAIAPLPPAALRLSADVTSTLSGLGIRSIDQLIKLERPALTRRFGKQVVMRLDQAIGELNEFIKPKEPSPVYSVRLDILETVSTAEGIAIGVTELLNMLCYQLDSDQRGLREVKLTSYRVDGFVQHIVIGTSTPTRNPAHVFRLFRDKLTTIAAGLGIELFILSATKTESLTAAQEQLIHDESAANNEAIAELVDRLANRLGKSSIYRFQPHESHIPERAVETAPAVSEPSGDWPKDKLRPVHILQWPEKIEVQLAPIPDYPPRQFKYKGHAHRIKKADGPERIEAEWWSDTSEMRDYYRLEDDQGRRYWVYRLGHYKPDGQTNWFIHGFFG